MSSKINIALLCLPGVLALDISLAAPIGTNTALPLSSDEIIVREQFVATHSSDSVGDVSRHIDRFEARTVLGYGLSSKLAFFGVLPLVHVDRTIGGAGTSEFGLGDASFFGRYEIYRADDAGKTRRIAPYAGIRVPSGRDGITGDGSVDLFGGIIATVATTQWVLDSQLRYDLNREADGFERGDTVSFETSFQYRLSPSKISRDTTGFVFGVLELSANYAERNRVSDVIDANSGGFQLSVTPGIQYATRRWIADLGVKVPIVNNLNGTALAPDYSILTSFRVNF